jgi:8-oxo-dGTP pyrophosphatase MutT (NUDIX family)
LARNRKNKPEHWYRQSAAIPYFIGEDGKMKVVLITSRKQKRWMFPKGIVEPDLSPAESAAKECIEEAGVEGTPELQPIGEYETRKWGGNCRVEVYPFLVEQISDSWAEAKVRQRVIVGPKEAMRRIGNPGLRSLFATFAAAKIPVPSSEES